MSHYRKPRKLVKGDKVAVAAPAGRFNQAELLKGIETIKSRGYEVVSDEGILSRKLYLAGEDERRAREIEKYFLDPEIKAVFCARGGYGSARTASLINWDILKNNPKIFAGYSDLTFILLSILKLAHFVCFHGPVVSVDMGRVQDKQSVDFFFDMLETPKTQLSLKPQVSTVIRDGKAEGILTGGCLSLIVTTLGTRFDVETKGRILFIEDIGEPAYRIDRMIEHLRQAGKLDQVSGIVFGTMERCGTNQVEEFGLLDVVRDSLRGINVPVLMGFPSGHGNVNLALPFGAHVGLDADNADLIVKEEVVI